ncbi:MAG: LPS export ABC transporter permease LptG [Lysobacteraceae bacterium]
MSSAARMGWRIHDRLVMRAVLGMLLPVWLLLLGFDGITAFVSELDELGEGSYHVGGALLYTLYTLPRRAYELFPTAVVLAALLGLGALAARSELTALRAAGLSRRRIVRGLLVAVFLLTGLMMLVAETVGPAGEKQAQALVVAAKSDQMAVAKWSGLWAREGDTYLNAKQGLVRGEGAEQRVELSDVDLFAFDPDGRLLSITAAKRAEHRHGEWTLFELSRSHFEDDRIRTETLASERWPSELDPQVLSLGTSRPRYLSTQELSDSLDYMSKNNLDGRAFASAYWQRWFYPLNILAMLIATLPFAFGTLRSGGFGKRLMVGVVIAVGYHLLLRQLVLNMAEVYGIDLRLANALPPLLLIAVSWLYFRRQV